VYYLLNGNGGLHFPLVHTALPSVVNYSFSRHIAPANFGSDSVPCAMCYGLRSKDISPLFYGSLHLPLPRRLMFSAVSVCLSLNTITQKLLINSSWNFTEWMFTIQRSIDWLDFEWPWTKVKVTRGQKVKIVFVSRVSMQCTQSAILLRQMLILRLNEWAQRQMFFDIMVRAAFQFRLTTAVANF